MPKRAHIDSAIGDKLRDVGYGLIQFDSRLRGVSDIRPDVLAWASSSEGELVPWAVVEVKAGGLRTPELTLPALAKYRDLLGTVDHYAVVNGQWFKADRGVRSLEPVDGPMPPPHGTSGFLTDLNLATSLLMDRLWFEADQQRSPGVPIGHFFPSPETMAETAFPGIETPLGDFVPVRPDILWRARRRALVEFTSRSPRAGEYSSHPTIAHAVASLIGWRLGGMVLDPFCGTGSFLWAAMDRALEFQGLTEFAGVDLDQQLVEIAEGIGRAAPLPTTVQHGDAFEVELTVADVVVMAPPFGVRLGAQRELQNGSTTTDMDVAAVDLGVRHLRPGGRAVFHLPSGFAFHGTSERYRQFLASHYRVAALIGLPTGAVPSTGVRSVLLVVDNTEPGETFVAQLGEDWETQLMADGAALTAALRHIDDVGDED